MDRESLRKTIKRRTRSIRKDFKEGWNLMPGFNKAMVYTLGTATLLLGLGAASEAVSPNKKPREKETKTAPAPTREQRLAVEYETNTYSKLTRQIFDYLVDLPPDFYQKPKTIAERLKAGEDLQGWIMAISRASFARSLDQQGVPADDYELAQTILPGQAQHQLKADGYNFVEVTPVSCDWSNTYDPLDYSNHPPSDFAVKAHMVGGREVIDIPLGGPQQTMAELNPLSRYIGIGPFFDSGAPIITKGSLTSLPETCHDYPLDPDYPPKGYVKLV